MRGQRGFGLTCLLAAAGLALSAGLPAQELAPRAVSSAGPGEPQRIGAYPRHENHPTKKWIATLTCEPMSYTLQHWACYHESHAPQAIALEGQIGMMSPGGGNWYSNGFFNFALDAEQGRDYAIKSVRALDSGERASCEFVWELPQAWVRVRFMALPDHRPLLCSIVQVPKTEEIPTLRVRLSCYPSGYFKDGHRVGLTAATTVKSTGEADLDPEAEWWIILYDDKYDLGVQDGTGGCAAITAPELLGASRAEMTSYGCSWELQAQPGGKELRFAFWDGLKLKNAELVPALKPEFQPTLTTLREVDFRPLRLGEGVVTKLKAEFEKLLPEVNEAQEEEAAFRAGVVRLEQLRPRATGDEVDLAAEDEYLSALDELESLLWQLRMKWVFSD